MVIIRTSPIPLVPTPLDDLRTRFLDLLYASALDPSLLAQACRALCAALAGERAYVYAAESGRDGRTKGVLSSIGNGDDTCVGSVEAPEWLKSEIDALAMSRPERVACNAAAAPLAGSDADDHGSHFLALTVNTGQRAFGFVVMRNRAFSEEQKSAAWSVLADVRRAFELHLRSIDAPAPLLETHLVQNAEIGFVATAQARILGSNSAAEALMSRGSPIFQRSQTLSFENAKAQAAFERIAGANDREARAAFVVSSKPAGEMWLVQLIKLAVADPWLAGDGHRIFTIVTPFNAVSRTRASAIEGITGLTATERAILRALVDGQELTALARETSRSIKTLRWHLRNLFAKLRVNSQSDLARIGALLLPI